MTARRRAGRLIPVAAVTWAAAAVVLVPQAAAPIAVSLWSIALVGIVALAATRIRPAGSARTTVLLVVVIGAAAGGAAASHVAFVDHHRAQIDVDDLVGGRSLAVHATATGKVERRADGSLAFDAVADSLRLGESEQPVALDVVIVVDPADVAEERLDVGATVVAVGTAERGYPGDRAAVIVRASRGLDVVVAPTGVIDIAGGLRQGLVTSASRLVGDGADLLPGLAVGDTSAVGSSLDTAMKASSLSHLTAVSGANCALVVGIAYAATAAVGAGRRGRAVAGATALVGFAVLVTPEPSVVRASAMAAIAMLAVLRGRAAAGLAILSLAVAGSLIADPWLSTSLGFALSVCATAALLLLSRPLALGLERALPRSLAMLLAVPLSAQLACGPLLVLIAPSVPVYGVVANVLAAPAAPMATVVGLFACLAAPIPLLQDALTALAWLPASWIAATARVFADAPGASLAWLGGPVGAVLLAAVGLAVVVVIVPPPATTTATTLASSGSWRLARTLAGGALAVCVGVSAGHAAVSGVAAPLTVPRSWSVLACDVGQGDAILIRSDGATALVDTGPDPERLAACLDRADVSRLDLLVLTHFDADHAGAAPALIGRVSHVLHGPEDADGALLVADLARAGARTTSVEAGMAGRLGGARWRVLWPRGGSATMPGNDASVVLDVRGGGVPATLLLGDLSATPQRAIAAEGLLDPPYDVVKVAHHGSADQASALYAAARPALALLSVGADNTYGHPRSETLDLLDGLGARVVRTDRDGVAALWRATGSLRLWRERAP